MRPYYRCHMISEGGEISCGPNLRHKLDKEISDLGEMSQGVLLIRRFDSTQNRLPNPCHKPIGTQPEQNITQTTHDKNTTLSMKREQNHINT